MSTAGLKMRLRDNETELKQKQAIISTSNRQEVAMLCFAVLGGVSASGADDRVFRVAKPEHVEVKSGSRRRVRPERNASG